MPARSLTPTTLSSDAPTPPVAADAVEAPDAPAVPGPLGDPAPDPPAPTDSPVPPEGVRSTHAGRFRPELHGLRGLAIGLVVLYHVFFDRVSGGVDVFLFLSAFLLVGTFTRRLDRGQAMRPAAYWARTFKRLLPPTALVTLATVAGVLTLLPPERWMPGITDAIGSLLHVENWVLIGRGVDYYAAEPTGASPFQHFWSLSIQGQVFLLWPLLIALAVLLARAAGRSPRPLLAGMFTIVLAFSFAWSVYSTAAQQEIAYFDTLARLWEFAAGSLLGLALPWWEARRERRLSRRHRAPTPRNPLPRVVMGWLGLAALISCGLLIDVQGAFPGWIAAWPLAAAALVLLAGTTGSRLGADRLLSSRPAALLGDISYALYLVHWPLLTFALALTGTERAGLAEGLIVIAASLLLAGILTRLVDTPIRRWPWASATAWRSALVVVTCLVLGLAPMLGVRHHLVTAEQEAASRAVADNPGARVLDPDFVPHPDADPDAEPLPTAAMLGKDWVSGEERCTGELAPQGAEKQVLDSLCRVVPGEEGAPVLVSVGNSRLEQFSASLIEIAQREGWTLVTLWKGGCTFTPDTETGNAGCDDFSASAASYLERVTPEAVALNTTFLDRDGTETITPGMEQTLPALLATGSQVIALRDLPRVGLDPSRCAQEKGAEDPDCTTPLAEPLTAERPDASLLATLGDQVAPLEVNDLVCPAGSCPPVIGNVLVFLDEDHLTGTYATSMQDGVAARLQQAGFLW